MAASGIHWAARSRVHGELDIADSAAALASNQFVPGVALPCVPVLREFVQHTEIYSSTRGQLYFLSRSRGRRSLRSAPVFSKPVAYATETQDDATGCRSIAGPQHYVIEGR